MSIRVVKVQEGVHKDKIGIFHSWGYDIIEGETNVQYSVALVEFEDGRISMAYPEIIQFIGTISDIKYLSNFIGEHH